MKKYNLSEIMKRAWEIKKQDARNIFSECLRMAWAEVKVIKKEFKGYAEIESNYNWGTMYSFKAWNNYGKHRIYCNYRGRRGAGYIDLDNDCKIVTDCHAYKMAMVEFLEMYAVA